MIQWVPSFNQAAGRLSVSIGSVFTVLLIILVIGATAGTLANATTGITIAHNNFTPNPNITRTPGLAVAIPILPLIFIGTGIGFALDEMVGTL